MSNTLAVRKSIVEQAFDLAIPRPNLDGVQEELDALYQTKEHLLPIEELAKGRVIQRVAELETIRQQAQFTEKMLPLEPLGWRWPNGLPKLALLSLRGSSFNITAYRHDVRNGGVTHSMNPELPGKLQRMYNDVAKLAEGYCIRRGSRRSYTFTFDGVIPPSARQSIVEAMKSYRFESMYLLVEAPEKAWKIETKKGMSRRAEFRERMSQINLDPLVLGWAGEALWVIDKFDLTTLEQYILDEFSQKALLPGS